MASYSFKAPDTVAGKTIADLFGAIDPKGVNEGWYSRALGIDNAAQLTPGQLLRVNDQGDTEYQTRGGYKNIVSALGAPMDSGQALLDQQAGKTQDFLNRYKTGLNDTRSALEAELGLPQLRQASLTAGQTARDVSQQVQNIAPTQQTIAKQVGISAPHLAARTAAETVKLTPSLQAAQKALEDATANQQFGETQYTQRLNDFIQPFTLEASFLSDALAREFTGFTQENQNELSLTLQKMQNQQALSLAEINKANTLAQQEQDYLNQLRLMQAKAGTDVSSQVSLEQQLKNLGLGSYYQKPKVGSVSEWEYV